MVVMSVPSTYVGGSMSAYSKMKGFFTFVERFLVSPTAVGTPFACSPAVAKKILEYVPEPSNKKHHYLEIGPGDGAITDYFIEKLGPYDKLDLVEIDEGFYEVLQSKYGQLDNVNIYHKAIQEWKPEYKYDNVVTAVPLNALPTTVVIKPILDAYEKFVKEGAVLSAVEYIGTATLRQNLLFGKKKKEFLLVLKLKEAFFNKYMFAGDNVMQNLPPARVMHCKTNGSQKPVASSLE